MTHSTRNLLSTWIALILLILGLIGCGESEFSPIPSPSLATEESPVVTSLPSVVPSPAVATTPILPAEVRVNDNSAIESFPGKVTFFFNGTSAIAIKAVTLDYRTDRSGSTTEVNHAEIEYARGTSVSTSYAWDMQKYGSIPPGATISWRWNIVDEEGRTYQTEDKSLIYKDSRFEWNVGNMKDMEIYWLKGQEPFIDELILGLDSRLSRVRLNINIPPTRKPKVMIYNSSYDVQTAVVYSNRWTGALAFPAYNIILTAVNKSNLDWAKDAIAHEITHLLVGEAVAGPYSNIPTWLDEGLAQYVEGTMTDTERQTISDAARAGKLISMKSLMSSFPADPEKAFLAYAESKSFITQIIEMYGWEKMRTLISVFKNGTTVDNALTQVYSADLLTLEKQWSDSLF